MDVMYFHLASATISCGSVYNTCALDGIFIFITNKY